MHHGILAAGVSSDQFLAALNRYLPTLTPSDTRGPLGDLDLADAETGWHMAFGEQAGQSFIFDTAMALTSDPDVVVSTSRELSTTVVACGQETTSGSYWFFAAERGRFVRGYWNCHAALRSPWTIGSLASEETVPLEHLDGDGIMAALRELGFDYPSWSARSDLRELSYTRDPRPGGLGPLGQQIASYMRSVAIAPGKRPKPTVVRGEGGFDLATLAPKKGIRGLFRRGR